MNQELFNSEGVFCYFWFYWTIISKCWQSYFYFLEFVKVFLCLICGHFLWFIICIWKGAYWFSPMTMTDTNILSHLSHHKCQWNSNVKQLFSIHWKIGRIELWSLGEGKHMNEHSITLGTFYLGREAESKQNTEVSLIWGGSVQCSGMWTAEWLVIGQGIREELQRGIRPRRLCGVSYRSLALSGLHMNRARFC